MFKRFKALPGLAKVAIIIGIGFFSLLGLRASQPQPPAKVQLVTPAAASSKTAVLSDNTTVSKPKAPVITTKIITETQSVPFANTTVTSNTLAKGTTKVTTIGVNGVSTLSYKVTFTNGSQTAKELVSQSTTLQPITQVTSIGTYVAPAPVVAPTPQPIAQAPAPSSNCDPNYSGACVPNVYPSDVDCAGGSGNGPYYVSGPVRVIGVDRYDLDRDGDGIGCE